MFSDSCTHLLKKMIPIHFDYFTPFSLEFFSFRFPPCVSGVSLSLDKQQSVRKARVVISHEGGKDTSKGRYLHLITKETFLF